MVNFRERTISICGKDLKIKDTKVLDLENALKPVEKIEMERIEKQDEIVDLNQELAELRSEANDVAIDRDDTRNLSRAILNRINLSKEDISNATSLKEQADGFKVEYKKIMKEIKKIEKNIKNKVDEFKEFSENAAPKIREYQGKACETLLEGITTEEFIKEYRLADKVIVENMGPVIEMHLNNVSQDKIDQKIKEIAASRYDTSFQ